MKHANIILGGLISALIALTFTAVLTHPVHAHCDKVDGPVVTDAREALRTADVAPVLKWIAPDDEGVIREAFENTLAVRELGSEAKALADRHFFETLVRIHRAWEGAPFTGLKPADTPVHPAIEAADEALETGSDEALLDKTRAAVTRGMRERFQDVQTKKAAASDSAEAGRAYVKAYVEYVHYVLGVHKAIAGTDHGPAEE